MSNRGFEGLGMLLAAAWLGLAPGCGGRHDAAPAGGGPPVAVRTAVAALSEVTRVTEATGSVEPRARVSPGTKILGRVQQVLVAEGDRVDRGQPLAGLEKRDLEAAVQQARAAVAMAEARLENAQAHHRRITELHARGSVTEKNLEDAVAGFRIASAEVEQARADLAAAEVTLGYADIRSPVTGWVIEKLVEAGDMAAPGAPMFRIDDLSRVEVTVTVPESEIVGLREGDPATVLLDVLSETREAEIARVVPAGDPLSRTFAVRIVLPNPEGRIKAGMFARVRFARGTRPAVVVPPAAVVERGQLRGLFVVEDDGRARLRWVRLGRTLAEGVEVLAGLAPGDRFLVAPAPGFVDGTPVIEG